MRIRKDINEKKWHLRAVRSALLDAEWNEHVEEYSALIDRVDAELAQVTAEEKEAEREERETERTVLALLADVAHMSAFRLQGAKKGAARKRARRMEERYRATF